MQIFCTLFDSKYLSRGLACYESLLSQTTNLLLYVFAFDDLSFEILSSLNYKNLKVISLHEFEDDELLRIKASRSPQEYCWTCTPSAIKYVLEKYGHEYCTYLDADMIFYRNPETIFRQMKDNSVLITPHYYTPEYDSSSSSGIYCVQFMTFRNDQYGRKVLIWWREACLDWCFNKIEDGKFGDQKYLDKWPIMFEKVYITPNVGEIVGPWNIQHLNEDDFEKIIFYHFHGLKIFGSLSFKGEYKFPKWTNIKMYCNYIKTLKKIEKDILTKFPTYAPLNFSKKVKLKFWLKFIKELFKFKYNFTYLK